MNFASIPFHIISSFINILRKVFAKNERWPYIKDSDASKIIILNQFPKDEKLIEKKPAVIVGRGPMAWQTSSINRLVKGGFGNTYEAELVSGSVRVSALSHLQTESEDIASFLFTFFMSLRLKLHDNKFLKLESIALSPVMPKALLSGYNLIETAVDISLILPITWTITESGQLLEIITLNIDEYMQPLAERIQIMIK